MSDEISMPIDGFTLCTGSYILDGTLIANDCSVDLLDADSIIQNPINLDESSGNDLTDGCNT
jgi:hypothetical protein